jgi:hypothetical protein
MPNQNSIIFTGADYKAAFNIPGVGVFMLKTLNNLGWDEAADNEMIYAIGDTEPIGNKQNASKYSGKFSIQEGEMYNILVAAGTKSAIKLQNVTLSITSLVGGPAYTFSGMCLNTSGIDVKAKDKESIRNIAWTAISIS